MFLSQLFEAIDKRHAAFCFGRMNPPTLGHKQLADTVARAAHGGDYFIFTSQSQDSKKNPLDYATKVKFLKALMPEHAGHVVYDSGLKTIIQIAHWLYNKGYRSVTFVAGSDRIEGFTELLNKYNGVEGPSGFYKFDTINFASSGDRDPDGDGLAGISATAAREAAKANNLEAFAKATGAGELAPQLFQAVRKGMLLESYGDWRDQAIQKQHEWHNTERGDANFVFNGYTAKFKDDGLYIYRGGDLVKVKKGNYLPVTNKSILSAKTMISHLPKSVSETEYDKQNPNELRDMYNYYVNVRGMSPEEAERLVYTRDEPVNEGASGYIPKNKREAKDRRWSNALTVDVHPDTPRKNMKALRLI